MPSKKRSSSGGVAPQAAMTAESQEALVRRLCSEVLAMGKLHFKHLAGDRVQKIRELSVRFAEMVPSDLPHEEKAEIQQAFCDGRLDEDLQRRVPVDRWATRIKQLFRRKARKQEKDWDVGIC